jgi:hypothetical protein
MSGVNRTCFGGWFNGKWQYVGQTADGRPFYKKRFWLGGGDWYYLYYDKDCSGSPVWLINSDEPSTTAEQDLDGKCTLAGRSLDNTRSVGCAFPTEVYTRGCHWFPRLLA